MCEEKDDEEKEAVGLNARWKESESLNLLDTQSTVMQLRKGEDSDEEREGEREGEEERGCQSSGVDRRKLCVLAAEV